MVEVQERRLVAFFQFANSVTFKGYFSQEKSSSKKYRTFKRKNRIWCWVDEAEYLAKREREEDFNFRPRTVTFVYQGPRQNSLN